MRKDALLQLVIDGAGLKFGFRTAEMHLTNTFNTVVAQIFQKDPNNWTYFTKVVPLTVVDRKAEIDIPIIQTSTNSRGIPRITLTDQKTECYPVPAHALYSASDVFGIQNMIGYVTMQDRVEFTKGMPMGTVTVYAWAVVEFSQYADDDQIILPSGVSQLIVDQTIAAMKTETAYKNIHKS